MIKAMKNTVELGILSLQLSKESKQYLRDMYPAKYPDWYGDHVTLVYGAPKEATEYYAGKLAIASIFAYASNDRIEAVRVSTHGLPDTYGTPHITLSAKEGVAPFESVAMLKSDHDERPLEAEVDLSGTIEFIPFTSEELAEFMQGSQRSALFYFSENTSVQG